MGEVIDKSTWKWSDHSRILSKQELYVLDYPKACEIFEQNCPQKNENKDEKKINHRSFYLVHTWLR
jgi:hypothetical protein